MYGVQNDKLFGFVTGPFQDATTAAEAKVADHTKNETFDNDDEALDAVDNGAVVGIYFALKSSISDLLSESIFWI